MALRGFCCAVKQPAVSSQIEQCLMGTKISGIASIRCLQHAAPVCACVGRHCRPEAGPAPPADLPPIVTVIIAVAQAAATPCQTGALQNHKQNVHMCKKSSDLGANGSRITSPCGPIGAS